VFAKLIAAVATHPVKSSPMLTGPVVNIDGLQKVITPLADKLSGGLR